MAVDANVLINERIREELRLGKSTRAAIESATNMPDQPSLTQISRPFSQSDSFPVRLGADSGFAVTLCIGIVSTLFTAVVVTRLCMIYLLIDPNSAPSRCPLSVLTSKLVFWVLCGDGKIAS